MQQTVQIKIEFISGTKTYTLDELKTGIQALGNYTPFTGFGTLIQPTASPNGITFGTGSLETAYKVAQ